MRKNTENKIYDLQRKPFVTYGFLAITILMFLIMTFNGGSENPWTLVFFGAKINELIILGEWWRLITQTFLHIGFNHLLFKVVIIYFLGSSFMLLVRLHLFFIFFFIYGFFVYASFFFFSDYFL